MKIKLTEDQRKFINIFDIENKGDKFHFSGSYYFIMTLEDSGSTFEDIGNEPVTKEFLESENWKLNYEETEISKPRLWIKNRLTVLKEWRVFRKYGITIDWGLMENGENHFIITETMYPIFDGQLVKKSDYFQLMKFLNIE